MRSMIPAVIGTVAGSYRITGVVGHGGMATVYRAEHTLIGRSAAVKILNPEYAVKKSLVTRFFNEARVTTAIKHPGIVEVYDFGHLPSGQAFLVMEFLEGMPLSARNKRQGAVSEGEAAAVLRAVCSALAAAHAKGVVHRDLKPDNIFMVPDGDSALGVRPKLLDFGIAKLSDVELAGHATRTGAVIGTPAYMSPEQCAGNGQVDHRADLYSLGCIFYEMVTGRPPFSVRGAGELIAAHMMVTPEPPSRTAENLSPDTEALIMALLAKQPEQRPQSATELAAALSPIANRGGWPTMMSWESVRASIPPDAMATISTPGSTPGSIPGSTPGSMPGSTPGSLPTPGSSSWPASQPTPVPTPGSLSSPSFAPQPTPAPDAAARPTTLSGAVSHVTTGAPARGSRVMLGGIIAAAVLVGGVAATFVLRGSSTDEVTPASAPVVTPPPATVTMPLATPVEAEPVAQPAAPVKVDAVATPEIAPTPKVQATDNPAPVDKPAPVDNPAPAEKSETVEIERPAKHAHPTRHRPRRETVTATPAKKADKPAPAPTPPPGGAPLLESDI